MATRKRDTLKRNRGQGGAAEKSKRPSKKITLESPVPSILATQMGEARTPAPREAEDHDQALSAAATRASELISLARTEMGAGRTGKALEPALLALAEADRAPPPGIAHVIDPAAPLLERIFKAQLGSLDQVPRVIRSGSAIANLGLDHRTGFLLSRIDGALTIDQLLDVSGMGVAQTLGGLIVLVRAGVVGVR